MKYLKPKLFSVMKNYTAEQGIKDLIAGIIVAIIALPLSIALAIASGVEPACGVYTAIAAGFVERVLEATDTPSPFGAEFEPHLPWLQSQL